MNTLVKSKWFVPCVIFLLVIIAISVFTDKGTKNAEEERTTEKRLEEMCNLVKGVSNAKVMLTYEAEEVAAFGYGNSPKKILGIAIACNGGDSPEVKLALYELVNALFDIKSTRVTVSPRN